MGACGRRVGRHVLYVSYPPKKGFSFAYTSQYAHLVGDMPFLSYQTCSAEAIYPQCRTPSQGGRHGGGETRRRS